MMLWLRAIGEGFLMSIAVDIAIALGVVTLPILMIGWPVTWAICSWIRHEQLLEEEKKKGR